MQNIYPILQNSERICHTMCIRRNLNIKVSAHSIQNYMYKYPNQKIRTSVLLVKKKCKTCLPTRRTTIFFLGLMQNRYIYITKFKLMLTATSQNIKYQIHLHWVSRCEATTPLLELVLCSVSF